MRASCEPRGIGANGNPAGLLRFLERLVRRDRAIERGLRVRLVAARLVRQREMVADDAERGVLGLHARLRFLEISDRGPGNAAAEQDPAERVGRVGIVRHQGLCVLGEVERAIEVLARLGIEIREVVLRLREIGRQLDRLLVVRDGHLGLAAVLVEHAEEVVDARLVRLPLERLLVDFDRLRGAAGPDVQIRELLVARHVVRSDFDRVLERLRGVVDAPLRKRHDRGELLELGIVGLLGQRLLDPRERFLRLPHLLLDLEQTAQDVRMIGPLLERFEQQLAGLGVLTLRGVDAA